MAASLHAEVDGWPFTAAPAERRWTLCAQLVAGSTDAYVWNVRLQGEGETLFFRY